jgi:hypothetical protein
VCWWSAGEDGGPEGPETEGVEALSERDPKYVLYELAHKLEYGDPTWDEIKALVAEARRGVEDLEDEMASMIPIEQA